MTQATTIAVLANVLLMSPAAPNRPALPPPPNPLALLSNGTTDALAGSIRGYLVRSLPNPLFESSPGWGATKLTARGIKWKGQGLGVHPEPVLSYKNDGNWKKIRLTADNLPDTLIFDLRDVRQLEPGRLAFTIYLSFDARLEYTQQNWESGMKLYDGSARARFRIKLTLPCEVTASLEASGRVLPDAVFRLRVVSSDLRYDQFVMEHVAGVGGEAARILGNAFKGGMEQWHPALERELIAKANAAIARAGDNKEVRVSLSKVINSKLSIDAWTRPK